VPDAKNTIQSVAIGDTLAAAAIVEHAHGSDDVILLVAAAVFAHDHDLLVRAQNLAQTTSERQLVAIAAAHLSDDAQRVRELARDHLADHPDSVLVAWISARSGQAERKGSS
jgi:predicted neutral ceramidase superfamily lipid hydrolase